MAALGPRPEPPPTSWDTLPHADGALRWMSWSLAPPTAAVYAVGTT